LDQNWLEKPEMNPKLINKRLCQFVLIWNAVSNCARGYWSVEHAAMSNQVPITTLLIGVELSAAHGCSDGDIDSPVRCLLYGPFLKQ
jgi:hypothetical protein